MRLMPHLRASRDISHWKNSSTYTSYEVDVAPNEILCGVLWGLVLVHDQQIGDFEQFWSVWLM